MWIRNILAQAGIGPDGPTEMKSDNISGISWAGGEKIAPSRAKHIDVRVHFIRDLVSKGKVDVSYIPSEENDADILTKPLGRVKFMEVVKRIGLHAAVEEEC